MSVLVFAASMVLVASAMREALNPYDEGLIVVGASRTLAGEVPYRDFWTMYGPGQFYTIAALMLIFGKYVIVERIYDCIVSSIIVLLSYLIVRRFTNHTVSLLTAFGVVIVVMYDESYAFPIFPSLCCSLAAISVILRFFERPHRWVYLLASGSLTGLAALFRHDLGLYTIMACFCGLFWFNYSSPTGGKTWLSEFLKQSAVIAGASLIVLGPILAWLFASVPLRDLYQNLVQIPAFIYPKVRALPFPRLPDQAHDLEVLSAQVRQLVSYVPILVVAVSTTLLGLSIATGCRSKSNGSARLVEAATVLMTACTGLFFIKGLVRVSPEHMIQSVVCALILLPIAARLDVCRRPPVAVGLGLVAAVVAVPLVFFGFQDLALIGKNLTASRADSCLRPETDAIRCFTIDPPMLQVVRFVDAHTASDERIYVGPARHDKVFINDIMLYFAAQRLPATKWHDIHPGVQTTRAVQEAMILDLEAHKTRLIVEDRAYDDVQEPNDSRLSSGVNLLDEYIKDRFKNVFSVGTFSIFERK